MNTKKLQQAFYQSKKRKNLYKCSLPIQYKNIPSNILLNKLSIKQQNLVDASSYHFYIDQGRIYKIAPDYRINFKQTIQLDGITYNICFYINPKHINEITQQSYVKEMLDTLDKSKKYFKICILYKAIKNTKSGSRDYLQLQLDKFCLCAFWD
ncbi:unnamed protein product [Commensalibacter communis]|nr:unnamed protein product [Commensalibacter communis]